MPKEKILIDTNILVYATYPESIYRKIARDKIISLSRNFDFCISSQIIREYVKIMTSYGYLDIKETYDQAKTFAKQFKVLYDAYKTLLKWNELIEIYEIKGKSVYDCNIVATMLTNDMTHILTNDLGFKRYKELITVIPLIEP